MKGTNMDDFNYPTVWLKAMENHPLHTHKQTKENNMEQNTIEQMEQNIAQLLAKAEEMKTLVEKAKNTKKEWPQIGDKYWVVDCTAGVVFHYWQDDTYDKNAMKFGNIYKTKEDAENYVQKRLIQVELETLAKKSWKDVNEQVNWTDVYQDKYHIYYNYIEKEFGASPNSVCQHIGQVFFPTKESAMNAVETISEKRLKKLFM